MRKDIDILAIGEPLYELALQADGTFQPGFGGDTSNCVIAAARQDARVAYATMVGADYFGDALMGLWRREGVDISGVSQHETAPTGIYFVISTPNGHEFIYRRQDSAASLMSPSVVPAELIRRARVLHVSGISQAISRSAEECIAEAIRLAKASFTMVSYDTNFRARLWPASRAKNVIAATLAKADVALPSLDDMTALFGAMTPDEAIDHCLGLGAGIVAMTMGRDGAIVADSIQRRKFAALGVRPVDATGAGDAFDGAFLAEFLRTADWAAAGHHACIAASMSTRRLGAVAGLPTRAEVEAQLKLIAV